MKKQNDSAKRKLLKEVVSRPAKVTIRKLPTGVRGLDDIVGGGIPEFRFQAKNLHNASTATFPNPKTAPSWLAHPS